MVAVTVSQGRRTNNSKARTEIGGTIHGGDHSSAIKQPATLRIQIVHMILVAEKYRINQR